MLLPRPPLLPPPFFPLQLMGLLEQCDTQAERKMVYTSIGSCPTEALKKQVLEWAVSSVKLQDFFYPLNRCGANAVQCGAMRLRWPGRRHLVRPPWKDNKKKQSSKEGNYPIRDGTRNRFGTRTKTFLHCIAGAWLGPAEPPFYP